MKGFFRGYDDHSNWLKLQPTQRFSS